MMILAAAAFSLIFSFQCSHEHGRCTSYPAADGNSPGGTILLACPAFHAAGLIDHLYHFTIWFKYCMGTNMEAHPASVAEFRPEGQGIFYVGVQHFQ
jgi:hypothetical protein